MKLLGLKLRFSLKPAGWELPATGTKEGDFGLPFFLFSYADDKVAVARGKTGGVAVWARATPAWLLESGVAGLD